MSDFGKFGKIPKGIIEVRKGEDPIKVIEKAIKLLEKEIDSLRDNIEKRNKMIGEHERMREIEKVTKNKTQFLISWMYPKSKLYFPQQPQYKYTDIGHGYHVSRWGLISYMLKENKKTKRLIKRYNKRINKIKRKSKSPMVV